MASDLDLETAGADPASAGRVPAEPGAWIFLFGDMTFFAVLFCVYLVQRSKHHAEFVASQATLNQDLGAVNTAALVLGSILLVKATQALRDPGRRELAPRFLLAVIGCGVFFVAIKAIEYREKFAVGVSPTTNDFYMYYFALTGLHLAHLILGIVVLVGLWRLSRKSELTPIQKVLFEAGACYWHMVDLLWIVLFPLLFLVR